MTKKFQKGFTIIELLVVIAIIAVLAAIVLVNVTGYINQGKNAAIKGNLATVLTNGAIFYDKNSNYTGFCAVTNPLWTTPQAAIGAAGGTAICNPSVAANPVGADNAWCACSTLKTTTAEPAGSTFCADYAGYKKVTANAGFCAVRCAAAGAGSGTCID